MLIKRLQNAAEKKILLLTWMALLIICLCQIMTN